MLSVSLAYAADPKANKIRIDDAGSKYSSTNVEGALQEIPSIGTTTPTLGNILVSDGLEFNSVVMTGDATIGSTGELFADCESITGSADLCDGSDDGGGGGGALSDLTDIGTINYTDRYALMADGTDYESRELVEADISDLQAYLTAEVDPTVDTEGEIEGILGIGFGDSKVATSGYILVADGTDFESDNTVTVDTVNGRIGINTVPLYTSHIVANPDSETFYGQYIDMNSSTTYSEEVNFVGLYQDIDVTDSTSTADYYLSGLYNNISATLTQGEEDYFGVYGLKNTVSVDVGTTAPTAGSVSGSSNQAVYLGDSYADVYGYINEADCQQSSGKCWGSSNVALSSIVTAVGIASYAESTNGDEVDFLALGAGNIQFIEKASEANPDAGYGRIWVKNETPNTLWFTDDAGSDHQLGAGSGTGDIETVGDCTTGACFTGASGTTLSSNTDLIVDLDNDANGTESFQVRDGGDAVVAEITEAGALQIDSNLTIGANGDVDHTITFDGNTSDGVITHDEDNDIINFDSNIANGSDAAVDASTGFYSASSFTGTAAKQIYATPVNNPGSSTTNSDWIGIAGYSYLVGDTNFSTGTRSAGLSFGSYGQAFGTGGSTSMDWIAITAFGMGGYGTIGNAKDVYGLRVVSVDNNSTAIMGGISGGNTNTMTNAYGIKIEGTDDGTGQNTITTAYQLYIEANTHTGSGGDDKNIITNEYMAYIDAPTEATNKYQVALGGTGAGTGIWFNGATGNRIFASATGVMDVAIGTTTKFQMSATGFGYPTGVGVGATVAQGTSKATGVTINTPTGQITTHNATLNAATIVSFTVTNSSMAATDLVILNHKSGGTLGAYTLNAAAAAAGSFQINLRNNTAGNLGEALVILYSIIKGSTN